MAQQFLDLERYEMLGTLGRGGMAVVYLARHRDLESLHAVKVLQIGFPEIVERLRQEGRIQATLQHPNVLPVTDYLEIDGAPALVMEYVRGPSLADLLKARRLSQAQADQLSRGIIRGVAAAHNQGLIHRDLKPANILLALVDGTPVPKVADFGLAKVLTGDLDALRTRAGATMGTPGYMAPEQIRDASLADARADVFSLGAVLYELVTGISPFLAEDIPATFERIRQGRYEPPRTHRPRLPGRMDGAIQRALQVEPQLRFPDAQAMLLAWSFDPDGSEVPLDDPAPWDAQSRAALQGLIPQAEALPRTAGRTPGSKVSAPTAGDLFGGTEATSEQTWDATPSEPGTAPEPSARRPRWAAPLLLSVVVALAALGAWWLREPEPQAVLSLEPGASQAQVASFEEAKEAMLEAEFALAERKLLEVLEARPEDPAVHVLKALVSLFRERLGESSGALERAARLAYGRDSPSAELALLLQRARAGSETPQASAEAWLDFERRHPGDPFVSLTDATFVFGAWSDQEQVARLERMTELYPDRPIAYGLLAYLLKDKGRPEDAMAVFEKAENAGSAAPWLSYLRAELLGELGRPAEARRELESLLALDGSMVQARTLLVSILLELGDDDARQAQIQALEGPTTMLADRLAFHMAHGMHLVSRGLLSESEQLWQRCVEVGSRAGQPAMAGRCAHLATNAMLQAHAWNRARQWRERMAEIALQPEVGELERRTYAAKLLEVEGRLALATGDRATARARLDHLEGLGAESFPDSSKSRFLYVLRIELLIAEERYEEALVVAQEESWICRAEFWSARTYEGEGEYERAVLLLEKLLEDPRCGNEYTLGLDADAIVRLAALQFRLGDQDAARAALAELEERWPTADPDHPLVLEAAALEEELAAPEAGQ